MGFSREKAGGPSVAAPGRPLARLLLVGVALGLAGLLARQAFPASSQGTATVRVNAPATVAASASSFTVRIEVEGVANLGAYEWQLVYDPTMVQLTEPPGSAIADGGFLGSSGRTVVPCRLILPPGLDSDRDTELDIFMEEGNVRFGCGTLGPSPPGPSGNGLLSTATFRPLRAGVTNLNLSLVGLGDPLADDIPASAVGDCMVIGSGSCTPPTPIPTRTPVNPGQPPPTSTPVSGQPPPPTATPRPPGPVASPTPLPTPLPGQREQVQLLAGCNLRAFQPQYAPGTELIAVVVDIIGGNPRLWFQVGGSTFFDLFDFRSAERSTKTVLGAGDEAGWICVDTGTTWNRPVT